MSTPFPEKSVISVCVTGAAGQIGYSLVSMIANGLMLGDAQRLQLVLLDLPVADKALAALAMELQDSNFQLVENVITTTDAAVAFKAADCIVMCGAFPRKDGMERKDLLLKNAEIFKAQGLIMREHAPAHCRVLVVGNPANTNALLLAEGAYDKAAKIGVHPDQITALTRLDHNRAAAEAKRFLNLAGHEVVQNVIIWGNHSSTQVPDVFSRAVIQNCGQQPSAAAAPTVASRITADEQKAYFSGAFFPFVQQRGAAVIKARGASSAASAAKAIVDHMRSWLIGTGANEMVSMAVNSDKNPYVAQGVPEGLVFSFPCVCKKGDWKIVGDVELAGLIKSKIEVTATELLDERKLATSEPEVKKEEAEAVKQN